MTQVQVDPAFGISVRTILDKDGRKEIVFQLPVPLNASDMELNEQLDKVYRAINRQLAMQELIDAEKMLEELAEALPKYEAQYQEITRKSELNFRNSQKKGAFDPSKHLHASEHNAQKAIEEAIKRDRNTIRKLTERSAVLKKLVNGHGAISSTDRQSGVPDR